MNMNQDVTDQATLLVRARDGDGDAFAELTDPYRRELQAHCYRMLGSLHDAEDALQDALLAAWRGLDGFQERASMRTWLYRVTTNTCLNARRSRGSRLAKEGTMPGFEMPEPTRHGEVLWIEPLPDSCIDGLPEAGPETRYELLESVSLAFVIALQLLPPRQVAVLVLRDVLGFSASEVAAMLDTTTQSVHSLLKRARANLDSHQRQPEPAIATRRATTSEETVLVARFVEAYRTQDIDLLVSLLTDDTFVTMPPLPFEYVGIDAVRRFYEAFFATGRTLSLVPTRANGQPAVGMYVEAPDGRRHAAGLLVLTLRGDRIHGVTRFETSVIPAFGLPRSW